MITKEEIINLLNGTSNLGNPNRGVEYEDIIFAHFLENDQAAQNELWQNLHDILLDIWDAKNAEAFSRAVSLITRLALMTNSIKPQNLNTYFDFIGANEPDIDEANENSLRLAMDSMRILQLFELRPSVEYWQSKFNDSIITLQLSPSPFAAYCFLYATLGLLKAANGLTSKQISDLLLFSVGALKMPKLELYSILSKLSEKLAHRSLIEMVIEEYNASMDTLDLTSVNESNSHCDNANMLGTVINIWLADMGEGHVQYTTPPLETPRQILNKSPDTHLEMAI